MGPVDALDLLQVVLVLSPPSQRPTSKEAVGSDVDAIPEMVRLDLPFQPV
jgi:hypothetical protein